MYYPNYLYTGSILLRLLVRRTPALDLIQGKDVVAVVDLQSVSPKYPSLLWGERKKELTVFRLAAEFQSALLMYESLQTANHSHCAW